jgi:hypothetical protein
MYKGMKAPAKNKNGLIIPPTPISLTSENADKKGYKSIPDRHHVYFPRISFSEAGELAFRFREHRFNSTWLPRFQHEKIHRRYNPLVREHPSYFLPEEEVMVVFLEEAKILEDLDVSVRAVDMINDAIYDGRVRQTNKSLESLENRLDIIGEKLKQTQQIEVVPRFIKKPFIELGRTCLAQAA